MPIQLRVTDRTGELIFEVRRLPNTLRTNGFRPEAPQPFRQRVAYFCSTRSDFALGLEEFYERHESLRMGFSKFGFMRGEDPLSPATTNAPPPSSMPTASEASMSGPCHVWEIL